MEYLRDESSEADASGYQRVMRTRTLRIEQACPGKFRLALHGRNLAHGARPAKSQWCRSVAEEVFVANIIAINAGAIQYLAFAAFGDTNQFLNRHLPQQSKRIMTPSFYCSC